ncbi:MAG: glycosyltransferase [Leptolyngbya sp. LCM1.Bin17]|nr:MAG: glycosyltransferase [Leptolyngbya sp. LCM1.Bin17]
MNLDWNSLIRGVAAILPLLLLVTSSYLALECVLAWFGLNPRPQPEATIPPDLTLAVLVPAHNEAGGIKCTLSSIQAQLRSQDRLLVVADNCTDDTAALARQMGARVIERHNPNQRGKGYALDFGLQQLAADPPDIVVLVDADCDLYPGCLGFLAQQASQTGCPVQATYLMETPANGTVKDGISAFAFKVKNLVRPLGLFYMKQPCLLTGTGIALPWSAATAVSIASGHIVEDMKLGLDLALAGYPPRFCQPARVISRLPSSETSAATQRTRWEHGHLIIFRDYAVRLFSQGIRHRQVGLIALGLELSILPISLQVVTTLALVALTTLLGLAGGGWLPFYLAGLAFLCLVLGLILAWLGYGRTDVNPRELLQIPAYMLTKVPLYSKFMVKPESTWVRTERDS